MNSAPKKPAIEGLSVPAASAVHAQRQARNPAFQAEFGRSVRMHPRLGLTVAAIIFACVVLFALSRPVLYKAEALITVEPAMTKVLSDGTGGTYDPSRYEGYLQQQMVLAGRADILKAAIQKLPAGTWQQRGESLDEAADRLQSAVKVERVGTSYQLSLTMTSPNPELAAKMVNAVSDAYLEQGRREERLQTDQRLKLLSDERAKIETELDQDRAEQVRLGAMLGVANPTGEGANPYDMQLAQVRGGLTAAQEARNVAAAQLASVNGASGTSTQGLQATAEDLIANDPGLSSMKSTINQRKAVLAGQMAGLTPTNPIYRQDQDEIADLDRSLDQMASRLRTQAERRLQDKLRLELARASDVQARLQTQLSQQTATATSASPRLQRAAQLTGAIQRLSLRYASVDDAMRGLELEASGPGAAHLSLPAAVPATPEPSRRKLLFLAALPLALLGGLFSTLTARKRDRRIYTGKDLAGAVGFSPIGVIPARGEVSEAVMAECTLRLAAGLQSAYRVSSARSFVFTGVSSSIAIRGFIEDLRGSLARLGFSATIVDAGSILERVEMPEGAPHEGYAAARIEQLKQGSDLLLIEAAPLLRSAVTESVVRSADATVLVVECGVTTRDEISSATMLLERLNVPGVGAVLQSLHMKYAGKEFRSAVEVLEADLLRSDEAPASRTAPSRAGEQARIEERAGNQAAVAHAAQGDSVPVVANVIEPQLAVVNGTKSKLQSAIYDAPARESQVIAEKFEMPQPQVAGESAVNAEELTGAVPAAPAPEITARPVRLAPGGVTTDVVQAVMRAVDVAPVEAGANFASIDKWEGASMIPVDGLQSTEELADKGSWRHRLFQAEAEEEKQLEHEHRIEPIAEVPADAVASDPTDYEAESPAAAETVASPAVIAIQEPVDSLGAKHAEPAGVHAVEADAHAEAAVMAWARPRISAPAPRVSQVLARAQQAAPSVHATDEAPNGAILLPAGSFERAVAAPPAAVEQVAPAQGVVAESTLTVAAEIQALPEPVAQEPVAQEPEAQQPVAAQTGLVTPVVEGAPSQEAAVEEPAVQESVADEPSIHEPVVENPGVSAIGSQTIPEVGTQSSPEQARTEADLTEPAQAVEAQAVEAELPVAVSKPIRRPILDPIPPRDEQREVDLPFRAAASAEPLTTGRWESGRRLRLERAAALGAPYARTSADRERMQAQNRLPVESPSFEPVAPAPVEDARRSQDGPLTRRWEMLSRFEKSIKQVDVRRPFQATRIEEDFYDEYKNTGSDGR